MQRANDLQKKFAGSGSESGMKNKKNDVQKDFSLKNQKEISTPPISSKNSGIGGLGSLSSPMSRASSMNSGLFDNLNLHDDDVVEYINYDKNDRNKSNNFDDDDDDDDYDRHRNKNKNKEKNWNTFGSKNKNNKNEVDSEWRKWKKKKKKKKRLNEIRKSISFL